ncbi:MAG: hypothetical protein HYY84_04530 [Deltaproteobacteria bacterium]|nr:hypothetical protein [Deltaproteobacteria bacterium]
MTSYDVVILGAGPAGMAVAAELAGHVRVLVIERGELARTHATWYSYADRVRDHGLDDAVAFRTDHVLFRSPNYAHEMKDDCVVVDHRRVLETWLGRARAGGVEFVQASYQSHRSDTRGVVVRTSLGDFRARLIIDCTGPNSPIVRAENLILRKDAWVLRGARVRLPAGRYEPHIAYYPLNDDANTYVGTHPFSATELNVYVFQGQYDTLGDPATLQALFDKTLATEFPGAEIVEPLGGTIVSGVLKRYALRRVLFFGAAGMMNPEAIGMGFNEVLRQVRSFAKGVRGALASDRLDARSLERVAMSVRDRETMYFQRIIGVFSLHFIRSEAKWDGGVRWLNLLGEDSRFWMRNELSLEWIRRATLKLHRAVPLHEAVKLIPVGDFAFVGGQLARFAALTIARLAREWLAGIVRRSDKAG